MVHGAIVGVGGRLTKNGQSAARAMGEALREKSGPIDQMFARKGPRACIETAGEVNTALGGNVPIISINLLGEDCLPQERFAWQALERTSKVKKVDLIDARRVLRHDFEEEVASKATGNTALVVLPALAITNLLASVDITVNGALESLDTITLNLCQGKTSPTIYRYTLLQQMKRTAQQPA